MFHDHEMDKEKMAKLTEMLKELGIDESLIDEDLMWTVKKANFKLMKLRLILDEKGIKEPKAKDIIDKMVSMAMKKDLAEIKKWHSEHEDKGSHWK